MIFNKQSIALATMAFFGLVAFAEDDCITKDDWGEGYGIGDGDELTKDKVDELIQCMKVNEDDDINVKGNGVIPDFGNGQKINWWKDGLELYIINTQKDAVCIWTDQVADAIDEGFKEGYKNVHWATDDYWMIKLGVAECDPVYGCEGNDTFKSTKC